MTILEDIKSGRLVVVPPVSVNPLEWDDGYAFVAPWSGHYRLIHYPQRGVWSLGAHGFADFQGGKYDSEDAAKAAAQADYEARILSAVTASPDHTTALLSLVEGVERAGQNGDEQCEQYFARALAAEEELARRNAAEEESARAAFCLHMMERNAREAAEAKVEALREALAALIHNIDTTGGTHGAMSDARRALTLAAEAKVEALREALREIVKADTHLVWSGGSVPEPSHDELGACAQIAARALKEQNNV